MNGKALAVTAAAVLVLAGLLVLALPPDNNVDSYENVRYGEHARNTMDIYLPEKKADMDGSAPVFMFIHGGGWSAGDKADGREWRDQARSAGCILVSINHRFILPGDPGSPVCEDLLNDIDGAVRYLKEHSQQYSVDTSAMGIGGYSSGGHLALLYSYARDSPIPIKFVLSRAGPTDFTDPAFYAEKEDRPQYPGMENNMMTPATAVVFVNTLAGTNYGLADLRNESFTKPEIEKISPLYYIEAGNADIPYTVLAHGSLDSVIPVSSSERLAARMGSLPTTAGMCELILFANSWHDLSDDPDSAVRLYQKMQDLLQGLVSKE